MLQSKRHAPPSFGLIFRKELDKKDTMLIKRRSLLLLLGLFPAVPNPARAADAPDERLTPRVLGRADAKYKVTEFFSLTCTHCAAFARETMPRIKKELIETGQVQWIFADFPLDRLALAAAMVARALPVDRYEPFVSALFASQDRWAFNREASPLEELAKMAMLAGMSRQTFDATVNDEAFAKAILAAQEEAERKYNISATPTFLCNGKTRAGEMSYDDFVKFITKSQS